MKKAKYIAPAIKLRSIMSETLLLGISSNIDVDGGDKDSGGTKDPEAKDGSWQQYKPGTWRFDTWDE